MRIQHNVTAMNSYRNFNTNNSSLSKNLEKLSSGYKINRAGDDAAGLAISEKMRAQITGIEGATKNAKDGISLIQTAEGALTEVHSMLNRMTTLAEQSANGTYDNEVDRTQLQKEVESLKSEIDRIADSTNYNGIKLLDGSLAVSGVDANLSTNVEATKTTATSNTYTSTNAFAAGTSGKAASGNKLTYTVAWKDEEGTEFSKTVELTQKMGSALKAESDSYKDLFDNKMYLVAGDGTAYVTTAAGENGNINLDATQKALLSELQEDENLSKSFDVKFIPTGTDANKLQFTAKTTGTGGAQVTAQQIDQKDKDGTALTSFFTNGDVTAVTYKGQNALQDLDLTKVAVLKGAKAASAGVYTADVLKKAVFEVDGKKFAIVGSGATEGGLKNLSDSLKANGFEDVSIIALGSGANTEGTDDGATFFPAAGAKDSGTVAKELTRVTGLNFSAAAEDGSTDGNGLADGITQYHIYYDGDKTLSNVSTLKDGKLELQIGDTSESFNKMNVNVADMHTAALGIHDIDISTQDGASEAMKLIKEAINTVSDTRGGLGALQNRLDHTINNLGVMRENIQNAESLIRDTDVAEEMMTYTKNSILNQSAQSMLAQANQLPQGVLQLLNG